VDRRKVLAALVAAGTPVSVLRDSLRREAMLTCMPLSVGGVLLGVGVAAMMGGARWATLTGNVTDPLLFVCAQAVVTVVLTWAAIHVAIRAVTPHLVLATSPDNLRTE
jgi:NO-binding membrane sensor protein with MHYT domain